MHRKKGAIAFFHQFSPLLFTKSNLFSEPLLLCNIVAYIDSTTAGSSLVTAVLLAEHTLNRRFLILAFFAC